MKEQTHSITICIHSFANKKIKSPTYRKNKFQYSEASLMGPYLPWMISIACPMPQRFVETIASSFAFGTSRCIISAPESDKK